MTTTALIRTSRDLRALLAARTVSELGTWFAYVALTVTVYDRTRSATWVSALLLLDVLPGIVLGLVVAPLLDRWVRKHVLVAAELVGGAAFTALVLTHSLAALFALAAIAGVCGSIVRPGIRAAVPSLVDDVDLPRANALVRSASAFAVLAGPPLAGVLVAATGTRAVFALDAATFVVSAIGLGRIPRSKLQSVRAVGRGLSFAGLSLYRSAGLRSVLASWCVAQFAWMLINVTEVFVARSVFHTGPAGFGLLAGAMGGGLLVGSLLAGPLARRASLGTLYRNALLLAATGYLAAAVVHSFPLALAAAAVGAAGNALSLGFADLTIQRLAPSERLGQAFGVFQSCGSACAVASMLAAGPLANAVGGRTAWAIAAGALVVAAAVAAALQRVRVPAAVPAAVR
jgi:MFS family permease